ncbi:hypothetical protein SNEBB_000044 [Seison nebaliae]|nr:hypothetical protein SNEBB_000044 [Seison nebaliae]
MNIGFIGLGNMGGPMALNLIKSKIAPRVLLYDTLKGRSESLCKESKDDSAKSVKHLEQIGEECSSIITMLPNTAIVEKVLIGEKGIINKCQKNSKIIDCSTIAIDNSRDLAKKFQEKNCHFIDAPVSGGVLAAQSGKLTFMVGAKSKEIFEEAKKLLYPMGSNSFHTGENGSGLAVKLANNLMLAISMIGSSEAMNLGIMLGVDKKVLADTLAASTSRCWSIDTYNPVPGISEIAPASRDYDGGFQNELMHKDLMLANEAANSERCAIPLGSIAFQIYRQLSNNPKYQYKDFSSVYKFLKNN